MAAAEAAKARKHPLDALSRNVFQTNVSRRSGLQDVDEEFMKQNIFCRQNVTRHSVRLLLSYSLGLISLITTKFRVQ